MIDLDDWVLKVEQASTREQRVALLADALELVRDLIREPPDAPTPLSEDQTHLEAEEDGAASPPPSSNRPPIALEGWSGWSIHCPFCGAAVGVESINNAQACRHLLYVAGLACFHYLAERMAKAVGLPSWEDPWTLCDMSIDRNLGGMDRLHAAAQSFPNSVRFLDFSPMDVGEIAFAAYPEELHGWGQEPRLPL
ncbi:MAG: hypothetical protein M9907_04030 [Burkholderiaceae bacterium]|nr:hypothetical protein [Burkholderiaceae bacterium]